MPRKPTWDDVPRNKGGQFAERKRVDADAPNTKKWKPNFFQGMLSLFWRFKAKRQQATKR